MTEMRVTTGARVGFAAAVLAFIAIGCGSDPGADAAVESVLDPGTTAPTAAPVLESATTGPSTTVPIATIPTTDVPAGAGAPSVAALTSGRGDDGSLEIGIWFATDPFGEAGARLLVGTDADESYPGTGDPRPHIDGWVEITDSGVVLVDDGATIVDSGTGEISDWFSWTGADRVIWLYFIGNVPVRAGTVWVALEVEGDVVAAGIAGAPFGSGCSYRAAGVDVDSAGGDIPDFGSPCRYPLG
jgi:hypothetical protein